MVEVLFIEDKQADAILMQAILKGSKKEKFNLVLASSFKMGTILLEQRNFDVILLSLNLRATSSVKTLLGLLKDIKDIPVIVCTDSTDDSLRIEALNSGAYSFIIKNQIQASLLIHRIKFVVETFKRSNREYLMFAGNIF